MPDWLSSLLPEGWSAGHLTVLAIVVGVSSAIVSLFAVGYVLARLPADYFVNPAARESQVKRHPIGRFFLLLGRNILGYFLVLLGIALSLPGVPGQGVLTILMGVMLIDLPGKHHLQRWLVTRRFVLRPVNRLRARFSQPPLITEPEPVHSKV